MKNRVSLLAGGALLLLATQTMFGVSSYVNSVPNGNAFSCSTCHVSGSNSRNSFGSAFANNGKVWNATLARADADRDGYTNGAELGDPNGTWTRGSSNPAGPVYNPGDSSSHPTSTPGGTAPVITTQPASQTVKAGATVTFSVAASGSTLTYQWQKDGVNIGGATSATLTLNTVTSADAGKYRAIVSNTSGSATSAAATLRVRAARKK